MSANQQAYTGMASLTDLTSEWSRLAFAIRSIINETATATLVRVVAIDVDTVDVQPMVAQVDGAGNAVAHGVIHGVPIWQLQGGASAVVMKPAIGDIGLAIFCHNDISNVKRAKAPSTPGSGRRYDWADAIYLGGVLNGTPTQFMEIDDATGITITAAPSKPVTITAPGGVTINGDVAVTGKITTGAGSTFNGIGFDTHKHTGVTTGGGTSGGPTS